MLDVDQRVRYWPSRAKLAGMFTLFPLSLLVIALGTWMYLSAIRHITPASVSVSGYFRRDGTYVNSYNRRPAGSVSHDSPYEVESALASIIVVAGLCFTGFSLYKFLLAPVRAILPPVEVGGLLLRSVLVPHMTAQARKSWVCLRCDKPIVPGSIYWYYSTGQGSSTTRHRYCSNCHAELQRNFEEEMRKREEQCEKYFGPLKSKAVIATCTKPVTLLTEEKLQSAIPPTLLPELIIVGGFWWEALLREAKRWTPEMDDDLHLALPTFDDAELFRNWQAGLTSQIEGIPLTDRNYVELWDALRIHIASGLLE